MIVPILHRIIIKPDVFEETDEVAKRAHALGLELARDKTVRYQESVDMGHVMSVGPTAFKDFGADVQVKVGDYVSYARNAGKKIVDPFTQEEFLALNDEDLVAIFKEVTHE